MIGRFNSFRLRLSLLFGGLALLVGFGVALYLNHVASLHMKEDSRFRLQRLTRSIAGSLAANLREREREVVLLSRSPLLTRERLDSPDIRTTLDLARQSYRHYAWIGVTDGEGTILTAADGLLEGVSAAQREWFIRGRENVFVGDVHEAVLLAKKLKAENPSEPLRFVDFAAPVRDAAGRLRGVLATHAHWAWVDEVIKNALPGDAGLNGVEVLIIDRRGDILYPYRYMGQVKIPAALPTDGKPAVIDWDGGHRYMTGIVTVTAGTSTELKWRVLVRQPIASALAPVAALQRTLLVIGVGIAVMFMFLAYRAAVAFSRPVEHLAEVAHTIEQGDEATPFTLTSGIREIQKLADSLRGMTSTLLERKRQLEESNQYLELKVQERTAELVTANRELERIALHDALTGLHNRRAANERLHDEFVRMQRSGTSYGLLLMDIDHFKRVNDTFGHEVGDLVLRHVAALLAGSLRQSDFVARFGGEEFLALLPDTDRQGALVLAEKLRAGVADSVAPGAGRVTISIGVAEAGRQDGSEEEAVRRADQALYRAKERGRNRVTD
ncbi:sensor domain-containing diguanylate cyclase [Trichlorobacter ammonificans]|uniref:diguanylate cyclase n=1 Tax=Trichlorobacter ammonificans TaxID=2916410 RepID=A0ABN8HMH0_9BACT|nr:diguanylate cyclase [Trichlorobacter ammonificans]CAH2032521.1 putative Diguanylate cyclase [Trichlorobacter ammonificans]